MSREERRGKTGWWLIALIGLIAAAAGIRYASSSEWWANTFDRQRQNFQTVNTGASIQVAVSTSERVPTQDSNAPRPGQIEDTSPATPQRPNRRMW